VLPGQATVTRFDHQYKSETSKLPVACASIDYATQVPRPQARPSIRVNHARNKPLGDNARVGAVRDRSQVFNPQTEVWTKRDATTGRFMDQKVDGDLFKGACKEKPVK
jgi:hypothetical protein